MHVEYPKPRWTDKFLLLDMLEGLKTTLRELFKPKVTIRYPEERLEPANRFRGMFRFSFDRCIACKLCALACPIDIIYIDVHDEQREVDGKMKKLKVLDRYDIDVKRCMFCSLCEEACPTKPKSIWLTTKTYELAQLRPQRSLLQHAAARVLGRTAGVRRACPRMNRSGPKQIEGAMP